MDLRLEPLEAAGVSAASADLPADSLPFLQSAFWSAFKAGFGWRSLAFRLSCDFGRGPRVETELRVMLRSLAGPLCFAYLPGGPALDPGPELRAELLAGLGRALRPRLPPSCLFLRFDPPWCEVEEPRGDEEEGEAEAGAPSLRPVVRPLLGAPLRKAGTDVQPPDTVLLSLEGSEEELLAGMKAKWRYNIRLASKKGVEVAEEGRAAVPLFYRLYEETAKRDRIAIHPQGYYEGLFDLAAAPGSSPSAAEGPRPDLRLWVARHEGEALAAIISLHYGETATYLYGASSDEKRSLMPTYALQWAAIRAAKAAGCLRYDFYGIPPREDPGHPMAGLYRFKTGFGGRILHYAGSWDLPLRPLAYAAWRAAEALRALWFKDLKKRLGRLLRGRSGSA